MIFFSRSELELKCQEIELQWLYLILARAVFNSKFPEKLSNTPKIYLDHGIDIEVTVLRKESSNFKLASPGIAYWLNQNFVIRLYGILGGKLLKFGKIHDIPVIILIDLLRNEIGAHSSGRRVDNKKWLKATELTNNLFGANINLADIEEFKLPIDRVLLPMKNKLIWELNNLPCRE